MTKLSAFNDAMRSMVRGTRGAVVLVLVASLLWGSAPPAIKRGYALLGLTSSSVRPALLLAGARFLVAGIIVLAVARLARMGTRPNWRQFGILCVLGLIQTTFQYTAYYIGLLHTTGVKASIIVASSSFFLAFLSPLFYDDRMTVKRVVGLAIGFIGIALANLSRAEGAIGVEWLGDGLILLTGICSASATLLAKRLVHDMHPLVVHGYQVTFGALILLLIWLPLGPVAWPELGLEPGLELAGLTVYLGLVTAVAFSLYFAVVKYHELSRVAAYRFLIPLSGMLLSALLIPGESLGLPLIGACVLVAFGIWVVNRPA